VITRVVSLLLLQRRSGCVFLENEWIFIIFLGFKGQTEVLARLFQLVSNNMISVPLYTPSQVSNPNTSNADFLRDYVSTLLQNAFPHLQR
jgi:hypothetical protein